MNIFQRDSFHLTSKKIESDPQRISILRSELRKIEATVQNKYGVL